MTSAPLDTDLFIGVAPFLAVAQEKSFKRAAQKLGVTTAAVSKSIKVLEEHLDVKLLVRTSRSVNLTAEGVLYAEKCQAAVHHLRTGRDLLAANSNKPHGELHVALPFLFAPILVKYLPQFFAQYPSLSVRLHTADTLSNLVDENIDVALRIGTLADTSHLVKMLFRLRWSTIASAQYLATHGIPQTPADLLQHRCLAYRGQDNKLRAWQFRNLPDHPEQTSLYPLPADAVALATDFGSVLVDAAIAGLGIAQVFCFMTDADKKRGALVEVLPTYATDGPPLCALYLPERKRHPNVVAFLAFLQETFMGITPP